MIGVANQVSRRWKTSMEADVAALPKHDDERDSTAARDCLRQSGYAALWRLDCRSTDGVIVLNGRVPSYYMKQLAQTFVRQLPGTTVVVNNVQVDR